MRDALSILDQLLSLGQEKLTSQQRVLIEQLAKEFGNDVAAKNRKFHL